MKNKKGFTLVELLAVIVILGIILVVAVPKITTTIQNAKLSTMADTTKMIAMQAEKEYVTRSTLGTLDQINDAIVCDDIVQLSSSDYENCQVNFVGETAYVSLDGIGIFDGYSCSNGTKIDANCSLEVVSADISGANPPVLASNMIPVMYNTSSSSWVIADETNEAGGDYIWYDYENKKWANIVLVTDDNRESYKSASAGTIVLMDDVLAFFVWIPRYIYNIPTESHHTNIGGEISLKFVSGVNDLSPGEVLVNNGTGDDSNGTWTSHPAFTFNENELTGIWIAKFETGYKDATSQAEAQQNVTTANKYISKPNSYSWRNINLYNAFTVAKQLEDLGNIYGFIASEVDTHIMKSIDWGAVAYLSLSKYGVNGEIWFNNNSLNITGCAGTAAVVASTTECSNTYETTDGQKASTTGNIYGIYDMAGGAKELVFGNHTETLTTTYSYIETSYWDTIKDSYANIYTSNDYSPSLKGDAMYETSSGLNLQNTKPWGDSGTTFATISVSSPWLSRGRDYRYGNYSYIVYSGILIAEGDLGNATNFSTFRETIVVE